MTDLGSCAVEHCDEAAQVDLGSFAVCVGHEGRRLSGDRFSVRQKQGYGGTLLSILVFHDSPDE